MVNENEDRSASGFTTIKPVNISLTATSTREKQASPGPSTTKQPFIGVGLVVLLLIAGLVFFLLPNWISRPKVDPDSLITHTATGNAKAKPANSQSVNTTDSPWQKAQRFELRKETQEILAALLDAKKTLSEKGVAVWAEKEFNQALKHAETGDGEYARQNFSGARDEYANALSILNKLVENIEPLFEQAMEAGNRALFDGDADKAKAAFNVALAIDSIDRAALSGRQRAETLDEVIALIHTGDELLQSNELAQAKNTYKKALAIDKHSLRARQQIELTESKIKDREFNLAMSSGFSSFDKDKLSQAGESFRRALRLKPDSVDARSGLSQTNHRMTSKNINSLLKQAKKLETEESWDGALSKYESVLSLDNTLANALEGKKRVTARSRIHNRLEQILAQPSRLFDRAVFDETVKFASTLRSLSEQGPVLKKQLDRLARLLNKADTPVSIQLVSDNLTEVNLYKVGELGYFTRKELSLRPGRYVAVGHREGYRDIRVEFFVEPDESMQPITIKTSEKIALGN